MLEFSSNFSSISSFDIKRICELIFERPSPTPVTPLALSEVAKGRGKGAAFLFAGLIYSLVLGQFEFSRS
jgi:hypothetical protein